MEDSAHITHHTNLGKASAPPLFSKMRTFFKNRLAWFHLELWYNFFDLPIQGPPPEFGKRLRVQNDATRFKSKRLWSAHGTRRCHVASAYVQSCVDGSIEITLLRCMRVLKYVLTIMNYSMMIYSYTRVHCWYDHEDRSTMMCHCNTLWCNTHHRILMTRMMVDTKFSTHG